MSEKTVSQLIEERAKKLDEMGMYNDHSMPYKYHCMDTGLPFMTYGEPATCSPYTGGGAEPYMESVQEQGDYMKPTGLPPSQKDPQKQVPVSPNPAPSATPTNWSNTPWSPNPAPDASGQVGPTSADGQGFVTYPQQTQMPGQVPPHQTMKPGERTDK